MPIFDEFDFSPSVARREAQQRGMRRATWTHMPGSYVPTLRERIAVRGRGAVLAGQHNAWHALHLAVATDPDLRAELEQARAKQAAPTRDRAAIVRACCAGELSPPEALELWKRAQG